MASYLGRLSRSLLTKEVALSRATYGGFMFSGGCGCAITHLAVVPLDVVKTRIQTRPGVYGGFSDALTTIREEEGLAMLFQGAGATGAGYFACAQPLTAPSKRARSALPSQADAAICARGCLLILRLPACTRACARHRRRVRLPAVRVLQALLLCGGRAGHGARRARTPRAARGRGRDRLHLLRHHAVRGGPHPDGRVPVVRAQPGGGVERYVREGGILSLYDGLIPLLVRQVLFGMVKFLVFDTCADAIKAALPAGFADDVAVSLGISLLSGAIAGVIASVVSQPADVVLSR
eukprot:2811875-Prymnesium_polylepis.1